MASLSSVTKNWSITMQFTRLRNLFFIFTFAICINTYAEQPPEKPGNPLLPETRVNQDNTRWELKLGFGSFMLLPSAKSTNENEPFFLPNGIGTWQLDITKHFRNKLAANLNFGIQIKKDVPPTPNIISVILGEELNIEGSGGGFIPLKSSILYYLAKGNLQPYLGAGIGMLVAKSQYTEVHGNRFDGITRTDFSYKDVVPLFGFSGGLGYRTGKLVQVALKADYSISAMFDDPIGGYIRYNGFTILAQMAFVF